MSKLTYTSGGLDAATDEAFESALAAARSAGADPLPQTIGGEEIAEGELLERRDPARTEEVASCVHVADAALVDRAVEAARAAAPDWSHRDYADRVAVMEKAARGIEDRLMEFAGIVSLETGKSRVEAIAEVQEGVDLIDTYCREMTENKGYVRELGKLAENERNLDVLRPYGVFGVIAPFNFPFALAINMSAAALIAGNAVVMKPSEDAPWSGAVFGEVTDAAGVPAGVLDIVHGGADTGRAIVKSKVDGVAFTGSAEVGRQIAAEMQGGKWSRPALMEMGGKNPTIVADSADPEAAAEGVARAAFGLSGQKCSACSRAIVVGDAGRFTEALAAQAESMAVGDPADSGTFLGPVINEDSIARWDRATEEAERDGRIVAGGKRPDLPGYYVKPTVVVDLPKGHRLTRDELFLPFVTVTGVESLEEAIEEANEIEYGLTAGIFTEKEDEVSEFLDRIEAGITYVNRRAGSTTGAWPGVQSFCGWKASGSTGKGGLGPHYLPQFMREQSRTYVS